MGKRGARTHCVHYLYANETQSGEEGMAMRRVQRMYAECAEEVSQLFREHFELGADFAVHFEAAKHGLRRDGVVNANGTAQLLHELSLLLTGDDALRENVMGLVQRARSQKRAEADGTEGGLVEMEMVGINALEDSDE